MYHAPILLVKVRDTGALKVGIFPYYVIRHGVKILLFGSLITVHHINNVKHVHDEPST